LPNGRVVVVTANEDAPVRAWDLLTGKQAGVPITGHHVSVTELDCVQRPDGRIVVLTGCDDGAVRVWDLTTGEPAYAPLPGHI
jgi:WD40 repeat protein